MLQTQEIHVVLQAVEYQRCRNLIGDNKACVVNDFGNIVCWEMLTPLIARCGAMHVERVYKGNVRHCELVGNVCSPTLRDAPPMPRSQQDAVPMMIQCLLLRSVGFSVASDVITNDP